MVEEEEEEEEEEVLELLSDLSTAGDTYVVGSGKLADQRDTAQRRVVVSRASTSVKPGKQCCELKTYSGIKFIPIYKIYRFNTLSIAAIV